MFDEYTFNPPPEKNRKVDILYSILAAIFAIIAGLCAMALYFWLENLFGLPLRVGIAFFGFTLTLFAMLLIASCIGSRFREDVLTGKQQLSSILLPLLGLCVAAAVVGCLFQWLYQLNVSKGISDADAYVFLVDTSASMDQTDPTNKRYDAIDSLIAKKGGKFPYMVYNFDTELRLVRPMAAENETHGYSRPINSGGTNCYAVLDEAMDRYAAGEWGSVGRICVLMVTDANFGKDSQETKNAVHERFRSAGIPISTVYVNDYQDSDDYSANLQEISSATGGKFVKVNDIENIGQAVQDAAIIATNHSLLAGKSSDAIHRIILRALAMSTLCAISCFGCLIAYGRNESGRTVLISSLVRVPLVLVICLATCTLDGNLALLSLLVCFSLMSPWPFIRDITPPQMPFNKSDENSSLQTKKQVRFDDTW